MNNGILTTQKRPAPAGRRPRAREASGMAADFLFWVAGEGLTQDRLAFQACLEADLRKILSVNEKIFFIKICCITYSKALVGKEIYL